MLMSERHPEFERLLQWQEGGLSAAEVAEVAGHVANCGFCSHRVERLASLARVVRGGLWRQPSERARTVVFEAFAQDYAPRRPLQQFIARLVYDSRTMGPLPGLRADAPDIHQLLYTSADADVALSLREQDEGGWSLIGQVLPGEEAALSEPAEVLVIAEDRVAAQATTTELGNFAIDGIAPGHYRVVVLLPHERLEIPEVALLP